MTLLDIMDEIEDRFGDDILPNDIEIRHPEGGSYELVEITEDPDGKISVFIW